MRFVSFDVTLFSTLIQLNTAVFPFKFNTKNALNNTQQHLALEKKKGDARQREQHDDDKTEDARVLLLLINRIRVRIRVRLRYVSLGEPKGEKR